VTILFSNMLCIFLLLLYFLRLVCFVPFGILLTRDLKKRGLIEDRSLFFGLAYSFKCLFCFQLDFLLCLSGGNSLEYLLLCWYS